MMNITELQIGDWVKPEQCMIPTVYCQVEAIYPDGTVHIDKAERLFKEEELYGIPIFDEILKMNSFTDGEYRSYRGNVWKLKAEGFKEIGLTFSVRECTLWGTKINKLHPHSRGIDFCVPGIVHVHQLQHAMRLLEIEKKLKL